MDMAKGTKSPKYKAILVNRFLANNLSALLERDYPNSSNRVREFSEKSKVPYGSVWRALKGEGVSLDIIEQIAIALDEPAWKLLHPTATLGSQMRDEKSLTASPDARSTEHIKQTQRISKVRRITK